MATGCTNGLALRVFGTAASLAWRQESPETLTLTRLGEPPQTLRRGGPAVGEAATHATRMPGGHPGDDFLHHLAHELEEDFRIIHATVQVETTAGHECVLHPDEVV